jgi:hypothetical protein
VQNSQVDGLAATHSLFGNIPEAAREQLGVEIARIGYDVLAAQKQDVAKKTGDLETGLSLKLILDRLRVKVGLLSISGRAPQAVLRAHRRARPAGTDGACSAPPADRTGA